MIKGILLVILLGIVPVILGLPWTKLFKCRYRFAFAYSIGYFMEIAFFHIIAFPITYFHGSFHAIVIVYSVVLLLLCTGSLFYSGKNGLLRDWNAIKNIRTIKWHEWILLIAFLSVVGVQLIRGITYDITYMSYDDAVYTTIASDALEVDQAAITYAYTGEASLLNVQRAIQTSLVFPAYLSAISGVPVVTIEHTIQYEQLILLAYITYLYIAGELFSKRDNQLMFLVIIAVFYWFGYHSHYSLTFRLLGPNYQGKAVLAVSLTPLVLSLLIQTLSDSYNWKKGMCLFFLSLVAVSFTLWGTGTMAVIVIIPVALSLFRREREWKHLLYILWGCLAPAAFAGLYLLFRFSA